MPDAPRPIVPETPVLMPSARLPTLLLLLLLPGCVGAAEAVTAVTVGSVSTIQRTPIDAAYSAITGKDCSAVRLDQGKTYCRPVEPPPEATPYCTRSLGVVDCWRNPATVQNVGPSVADGPHALTPEQESNRTRTWPGW
jgi:hypothetical protein